MTLITKFALELILIWFVSKFKIGYEAYIKSCNPFSTTCSVINTISSLIIFSQLFVCGVRPRCFGSHGSLSLSLWPGHQSVGYSPFPMLLQLVSERPAGIIVQASAPLLPSSRTETEKGQKPFLSSWVASGPRQNPPPVSSHTLTPMSSPCPPTLPLQVTQGRPVLLGLSSGQTWPIISHNIKKLWAQQ